MLRNNMSSKKNSKTTSVLFCHVPHAVAYLLKLAFRLSTLHRFFLFRLSVRLGEFYYTAYRHLCFCWHLLWKEFVLYAFDSDCLDTPLNRHLTKQSSPDIRGPTFQRFVEVRRADTYSNAMLPCVVPVAGVRCWTIALLVIMLLELTEHALRIFTR